MKYIRIKNGIYDTTKMSCQSLIDEKGARTILNYQKKVGENRFLFISYADITKQADNIEELCDEFVIKVKTGYLITYYDKKLLTQDANKNGADVYGAIWTDKGLIYVAKMNDKGELELL